MHLVYYDRLVIHDGVLAASPARLDLLLPTAIEWPLPVSARR
jgi:hypothetical protein